MTLSSRTCRAQDCKRRGERQDDEVFLVPRPSLSLSHRLSLRLRLRPGLNSGKDKDGTHDDACDDSCEEAGNDEIESRLRVEEDRHLITLRFGCLNLGLEEVLVRSQYRHTQ